MSELHTIDREQAKKAATVIIMVLLRWADDKDDALAGLAAITSDMRKHIVEHYEGKPN